MLETLFVEEDVYSDAEIEEAVGDVTTKKQEVALALQVIDSLAGEFEPKELVSEYRRDLQALPEPGGRLHAVPIAWKGGATFPVRAYVQFDGESG